MAKTRSGSKTPEDHLEKLLDDYLERLEDVVVGDAVVFVGPLIYGADEVNGTKLSPSDTGAMC